MSRGTLLSIVVIHSIGRVELTEFRLTKFGQDRQLSTSTNLRSCIVSLGGDCLRRCLTQSTPFPVLPPTLQLAGRTVFTAMATFRSPYANSSSQHLPTYPPSTEQISDEDYKIPYDEDIIDTYARDDDFPPRHSQLQVHPAGTPYLSPHQRPPSWQPPYPLPQKHSYSSERTGTETEFATHEGSREETFPLPLSKEKNESRGFWTTVRNLVSVLGGPLNPPCCPDHT